MHINPDHFLTTPEGRVLTAGRNVWAWQQCFSLLPKALASAGPSATLYILVGAQGAGKSTWARLCVERETHAIIFDAILVKRAERAPILAEAHKQGAKAVAVVFQTPLAICLQRNASRSSDEMASEQGLRNVFAAVELPTQEEGFAAVAYVGTL